MDDRPRITSLGKSTVYSGSPRLRRLIAVQLGIVLVLRIYLGKEYVRLFILPRVTVKHVKIEYNTVATVDHESTSKSLA